MNLCFQTTNIDTDCILIDTLKCQQGSFILPESNEFQQNFNKLKLPQPIVRSSSLPKKSNSTKKLSLSSQLKNDSINSAKNNQIENKNTLFLKQNINPQQTIKSKMQANTKSAIVNKLFQKNQILQKPTQKPNNKENQIQIQTLKFPCDQFYHKHQNVQKMIKLYKEKSQKQLKQCTFNPKINSQSSARNHDLKQFYIGQIEHTKRAQDKVQQMRLMIQAEKQRQNTFKPKLTEQTRQLTQRRSNMNVYDRLYKQSKQSPNEISNSDNYPGHQILKKQSSKKSILLVGSSKNKYENSECSQQNQKIGLKNNFLFYQQIKSQQLKRQKSVKTFTQILSSNRSKPLNSEQRIKSKNPLNTKRKISGSKQNSIQNSERKPNFQLFNHQMLDCRQLIKTKQQQTQNMLSKQQSCKIIPSMSKDKIKNQGFRQYRQNNITNSIKSKTNQKTQKLALEKFTKQFFTVAKKTGLQKCINLNQTTNLLKNMNFIQNLQDFYQAKTDSEIKTKFFEIWSILQGDQNEEVQLMNLFKILCAIQGYYNSLFIEETIKSVISLLNLNEFNQLTFGKSLILSQKDSKSIKKDFSNFHLTRFKLGESKLYSRQSVGHIYSFRPSISKESQQFAQKYRQRIIQQGEILISQGFIDFVIPTNGLIDHSTLLMLDQKIKTYKIQKKRLQLQRQRRRNQQESMTQLSNRLINETSVTDRNKNFSKQQELNSNVFSRISHNQSHSRSKDQIFAQLYQQGRKSKSNRRDKSTDEIQYEQNKQELTFKPKINSQFKNVKQFNTEINLHENIPNFTKQVMRMRKNKNINSKQELSMSPLLYLNVTMQGNQHSKIPVFSYDNLQSITEKVRIIMKIQNGQQETIKLKNILKEQIIPVLNQLGMKQSQELFLSQK